MRYVYLCTINCMKACIVQAAHTNALLVRHPKFLKIKLLHLSAALEAMQQKKEQHGKKCGELSEELLVSGDCMHRILE